MSPTDDSAHQRPAAVDQADASVQYMLQQAREQVGPILAQIERGELTAVAGAEQLVQTFGGFLDLLPASAQPLVLETARHVVIYLGGTAPVPVAPTMDQVRASVPLVDQERVELESLRQIVATLNGAEAFTPPPSFVRKPAPNPGEPGYDPAKDHRV